MKSFLKTFVILFGISTAFFLASCSSDEGDDSEEEETEEEGGEEATNENTDDVEVVATNFNSSCTVSVEGMMCGSGCPATIKAACDEAGIACEYTGGFDKESGEPGTFSVQYNSDEMTEEDVMAVINAAHEGYATSKVEEEEEVM